MKMFYTKLLMIMTLAAAFIGCPTATGEAVKISFSPNGGVGTMADQEVMTGTDAALNANTFQRVGYEFDGWNDAADGSGKAYADKGKINVGSAVKLYAQWKPAPLQNLAAVGGNGQVILTWDAVQILYEKIEITYDGAGEPVTVTPQNDPDDTATVTGLTNEKEYTFTATVSANDKKSRTATVKGIPSLSNSPVTVTFDSNPPESQIAQDSYTQVVLVNQPTALTACKFTAYMGYSFKGWTKTAEATVADYTDGGELTATEEDLANNGITLYAVWGKIPLTEATVTLPEDVTYLIGGTTVSLTETLEPAGAYVSSVSVEVTDSGSAAYDFAAKTLTLPSNTAEAGSQYTVTLRYHTVNEEGTEAVISATLDNLTVYPDKWVIFDNALYKSVNVFDFTDISTLANVKDGENEITEVGEEGYSFSVAPGGSNKKILNFTLNGSTGIVLTMVEVRWDRNNCANVFIAGGSNADYGWSPFKGNYSFMLGVAASGDSSGQRWNSKNDYVRLAVNPTENAFNRYFVFDNGSDNAILGFNDTVKPTTAAITSKNGITGISSIRSGEYWPLTFQHANGSDQTNSVNYTVKTVGFYAVADVQTP
ncbi:MAG: InlB B-repeat-containing protein [Spirochaetia bacterium]|nr:InlB B-repeat-containing protein [Spirochaetia bacterium]